MGRVGRQPRRLRLVEAIPVGHLVVLLLLMEEAQLLVLLSAESGRLDVLLMIVERLRRRMGQR